MKRILIVGASGFVGSHLARRLLLDGHEVHLLLRQTSRTWRFDDILSEVHVYRAELGDAHALNGVVRSVKAEWIFNCVGSGIASFNRTDREIRLADFEGAINLVRVCAEQGFDAFVHSGSSAEYGFKDHAPAESESCEPNGAHGAAKAEATAFCSRFAQEKAAPMVTLRLYTVYGPFESPRRLIPRCVAFGLRNALPPLARPKLAHDFVHVEDVTNAYVLAARNSRRVPGAVYNIGTGRQSSLKEVVDIVTSMMALTAEPKWGSMPDRAYDSASWRADSSLARKELGWTPTITLESGILRFYEWLKSSDALVKYYVSESAE